MLYYNILDEKRVNILNHLKYFKNNFYLAGGTALALQIGHRDSIDFDFFTKNDIDTNALFEQISNVFEGFNIQKVQEENNTLSIVVDDEVFISFMSYKYPLIDEFVEDDSLKLASLKDIAAMKLSAIVSRATRKDYIDLYFLLKEFSLEQLLNFAGEKFNNTVDKNLILKSLVYFDDVEEEKIKMIKEKDLNFDSIKSSLREAVDEYLKMNKI